MDESDKMPDGFPERLRELRKQKKMSQSELGKLAGIHYTHVGRYERGLSRPSSDTLQRLSVILEVSSDYLIEGKTEKAARVKLEDRDLLQQFREVEKLAEDDKLVVKKLIDAFLAKKKIQKLVAE